MEFDRRPAAAGSARELLINLDHTAISGLLAEPADGRDPRAVIVALHGAGMHAGYFHAMTAPGLSLLELGRSLGYTVWAPDRPGVGASAELPDEAITLFPQGELLLDAIDRFAAAHRTGAGVLLVGHSYGLKVAWAMAASPRGRGLLGLDGAGSGFRYAFRWGASEDRSSGPDGDRGRAWGPEALYPAGTFGDALPLHPIPPVQAAEGPHWPQALRQMAPRLRLPMRLTFGAHERFWRTDTQSLDELRLLLERAAHLSIEIEPHAGHNLSLGWAARAYHLKVLAFAEACILRQTFS